MDMEIDSIMGPLVTKVSDSGNTGLKLTIQQHVCFAKYIYISGASFCYLVINTSVKQELSKDCTFYKNRTKS